ncbi:MAG: ABC transporter permease [Candidatus Magasanikbacteria bacterium]
MKAIDVFEEIYWSLSANKVRSFLTILGIVIGIGSVISMVAIGQGAKANIQTSIQSVGSNLIIVTPGAQRGVGMSVSAGRGSAQTLVQTDADEIIKSVSLIKSVAPELSRRYQVTAKGKNTNTQVVGTVPAYTDVRKIEIGSGNFITPSQISSYEKVAVIGPSTRDDLFGVDFQAIGQAIKINGTEFKVVGITVAKGGSGFSNPDTVIYVPLSTAQRYLAGDKYLSTISVEAIDQDSMLAVQDQITSLLLMRHKISDPLLADFTVMNQADIVATASSITDTFTMLLAAIAGISLLVGGIGIMNMMLTTVTERTREIGLRKAIGADKKDISMQFLLEAVTLTFAGGIFGVVLGWILASLIAKFSGLTTQISFSSVLLAFGVSALIGIVFGYYPASRAAKLNPIEALRYE